MKAGLKKIRKGWVSRATSLSKIAAGSAVEYMKSSGDDDRDRYRLMGERLATELGEMKGLMMKLGQMASYLSVALPPELQEALVDLQDSSEPLAESEVRRVVEAELGKPLEEVFAEFDMQSIHAASIGQVHRASLHDGTLVAVKVQYPGIREAMNVDLNSAIALRPLLKLLFPNVDHGELLAELKDRHLDECDYRVEAAYQKRFREVFKDDPEIVVPAVVDQFCTDKLLVTEWYEGHSYQAFMMLSTEDERNRAGGIIHRFSTHSIFTDGIFNADPHPGNYLFGDGEVCFLDFGYVKVWEKEFIAKWRRLVLATMADDFETWSECWNDLGLVGDESRFDYEAEYENYRQTISHILAEGPVRLDRYTVENNNRALFGSKNVRVASLPREFLMVLRINFGLASMLANMNTRHDFRADAEAALTAG